MRIGVSSSNHRISPTSPLHPFGAGLLNRGLLCGLTKVYSGYVHIWNTQWTLGAAVGQYRQWLETTRQYTERSKREYLDDVSDIAGWLERVCRIRSVTAVRREHLTAFLAHCRALGHAASTRRRSVAAIRSFFAFLVQERVLSDSPARLLLPPERETRPPRVLTEAEYTRLRAMADNTRDYAIIELVLQTGLRLSEIARLTIPDVVLPVRAVATPLPVGYVRVVGRGTRGPR
jgi:integrase/recombinase XerD